MSRCHRVAQGHSEANSAFAAAIQFDKAILERIIFQYPSYIRGGIWFSTPRGFPPSISLRLRREAGEIVEPAGKAIHVPDIPIDANQRGSHVRLMELERFKQFIRRDGYGAIYWNERGHGAFVTVEVIDHRLEVDLNLGCQCW